MEHLAELLLPGVRYKVDKQRAGIRPLNSIDRWYAKEWVQTRRCSLDCMQICLNDRFDNPSTKNSMYPPKDLHYSHLLLRICP
jgi:hypothetical protein